MSITVNNTNFLQEYKNVSINFMNGYVQLGEKWLKYVVKADLTYTNTDILTISLFREFWGTLSTMECLCRADLNRELQFVIRTSFELFLQLSYYLQDRKEMENKCKCYIISLEYKRAEAIKKFNRMDSGVGEICEEIHVKNFNELYEMLDSKYNDEYGGKIKEKILGFLNEKKYVPSWYMLYNDNLSSLKKIAKEVNKDCDITGERLYNIVYGLLSTTSHGFNALDLIENDEGSIRVAAINNPFSNSFLFLVVQQMMSILSQQLIKEYSDKTGWNFSIDTDLDKRQTLNIKAISDLDKIFIKEQKYIMKYL